MNVGRIRRLAARIERLPPGKKEGQYDQENWAHDCGTPACIAAWTVWLFDREIYGQAAPFGKWAARLLGLTVPQGEELFMGKPYGPYRHPTPLEAADCLRNLADTGSVVWPG